MILYRQIPVARLINDILLICLGVYGLGKSDHYVGPIIIASIGILLLPLAISELRTKRIEVNESEVIDNGSKLAGRNDIVSAVIIKNKLEIKCVNGRSVIVNIFDISRKDRRKLLNELNPTSNTIV